MDAFSPSFMEVDNGPLQKQKHNSPLQTGGELDRHGLLRVLSCLGLYTPRIPRFFL